MSKIGMVLEGGALRGLFTVGVLDAFLDNDIEVDEIVGTSAGALFGVNFFSKQRERAIRYNKKYCGDKRYMSMRSLIKTGNYINREFAFYTVTKELDPFDNEAFIKAKKEYYAVATDVNTGKPEYFKITSPVDDLEKLRASSAIPLASQMVEIDGEQYLDGGVSDSIPIHFNRKKFKKNIIVLTQPLDYRKHPLTKTKERIVKIKYRKYPNLLRAMMNRHKEYNQVIEDIIEMEKNGEVFVIRPEKKINVKLSENNPEKLQEIYDLGYECAKKIIKDLKKFLKSK